MVFEARDEDPALEINKTNGSNGFILEGGQEAEKLQFLAHELCDISKEKGRDNEYDKQTVSSRASGAYASGDNSLHHDLDFNRSWLAARLRGLGR